MAAQEITQTTFKDIVIDSDKPVLVDFWADWCQPCKKLSPVVDEIAQEMEGKAQVAKVNVDQERGLATMFQIMALPTLVIFKDGKKVDQLMGARPKADIMAKLEQHL